MSARRRLLQEIHVGTVDQIASFHAESGHQIFGNFLPFGIALSLFKHDLQLHELTQTLDVVQMDTRLPDKIQVTGFPNDAANPIGKLEHPLQVLRIRAAGNVIV